MPTTGIRIRNANHVVQIDQNYRNLGLRYSTTLTAGSGHSANGFYVVTWTFPYSASQIVAIQATAFTCLVSQVISGGNITYTWWINQVNGTINVRVFDNPDLLNFTAGVPGIVMRNNGVKFFDSRAKYMKVVDFRSAATNPSSDVTVAPSGVGNLYAVQLQPLWGRQVAAIDQTTRICIWTSCYVKIVNNVATISAGAIDTLTSTNNADVLSILNRYGYAYMFLDCTGF